MRDLLFALLAGFSLMALDSAIAQDNAERPDKPASRPEISHPAAELVPFIDAHAHLNDEAMQLALMDRYGATRSVVFWGRNSDNEVIAGAALRHPGRFIPFVSISPERRGFRRSWDERDLSLLATLDGLLASGRFKGIGEISAVHFPSPGLPEADYDPNSAIMRGILDLARKYRVPVMVHIEMTRMKEFSDLLDAYRDVRVIWAHGGYTPLFLAARMLERHANLTYELSARTWPRHPRSPDYTILRDGKSVWPEWLALIEANSHRFIIGTDASQRTLDSDAMKFASIQSFLQQLSPAARERVARTNLLALIDPPG